MFNKSRFLIIFFFFLIATSFGQKNKDTFKKFNQKDFDRYKVDHNIYNFWWHENII